MSCLEEFPEVRGFERDGIGDRCRVGSRVGRAWPSDTFQTVQ